MRDFRDAKTMAHMLREALAAKDYKITVGESLELIARLFGLADWNTLSALIKNSDREPNPTAAQERGHGPRFAPTTEAALHRTILAAVERGQSEATVEHMLLSLTEDPDATAIMKARAIDPAAIRELLARSIEFESRSDSRGAEAQPSPAFQRVVRTAILNAQASGELTITGANLLVAIFSEQDATAVRILREQGLDRSEAVKFAGRLRD